MSTKNLVPRKNISPAQDIYLRIEPVNNNTVIVRFSQDINPRLPVVIAACQKRLLEEFGAIIYDTIPAYTTLLLTFDYGQKPVAKFSQAVLNICKTVVEETASVQAEYLKHRLVDIPVCYDKALGPDLTRVAEHNHLSPDEVVARYSAVTYQVCALGFMPGFAYLGELDEHIVCPRLARPRRQVPAGSVGIAEKQTGVYPVDSPGGWNIVGRTPKPLLFAERAIADLCLLQVGDTVRFTAISLEEFLAAGGSLETGWDD